MNVLILDGNENQAVACARSLGQAGHSVGVGSPSSWCKAGMSRWCRKTFVYRDPRENAKDFIFTVLDEARKSPGTLILPMTEGTTLPLSSCRDQVFAASARLVLPPHDVVLRAFDKSATIDLARSLGIAVPETKLLEQSDSPELLAATLRFPVVLKPRSTFETTVQGKVQETGRSLYARNKEEFVSSWRKLRHKSSSILVQEYLLGRGVGYFALMCHGSPRVEFAHQRIRDVHPTGSGSSLRVSVRPQPELRSASLRILQELGWHGVAMVEFLQREDGTLVFMEVNGRFWNSLALPVYAGVDFPAMLAQMVEKGDVSTAGSSTEGLRCRWLLGDFRHLVAVWKGAPRGFPGRFPNRFGTLAQFLRPVPGTFHDNFLLSDPLPELGDWMDFFFHRVPAAWKIRSAVRGDENVARSYSRT
jgi:predicted ATP-grasp superfamily ATP-dependent carboligase